MQSVLSVNYLLRLPDEAVSEIYRSGIRKWHETIQVQCLCKCTARHLLQAFEGLVASVAVVQDVQQLVQNSDLRLKNLAPDQLQHLLVLRQQAFNLCICTTATTRKHHHAVKRSRQPGGARKYVHVPQRGSNTARFVSDMSVNSSDIFGTLASDRTCGGAEIHTDYRNGAGELDVYAVPRFSCHASLHKGTRKSRSQS